MPGRLCAVQCSAASVRNVSGIRHTDGHMVLGRQRRRWRRWLTERHHDCYPLLNMSSLLQQQRSPGGIALRLQLPSPLARANHVKQRSPPAHQPRGDAQPERRRRLLRDDAVEHVAECRAGSECPHVLCDAAGVHYATRLQAAHPCQQACFTTGRMSHGCGSSGTGGSRYSKTVPLDSRDRNSASSLGTDAPSASSASASTCCSILPCARRSTLTSVECSACSFSSKRATWADSASTMSVRDTLSVGRGARLDIV